VVVSAGTAPPPSAHPTPATASSAATPAPVAAVPVPPPVVSKKAAVAPKPPATTTPPSAPASGSIPPNPPPLKPVPSAVASIYSAPPQTAPASVAALPPAPLIEKKHKTTEPSPSSPGAPGVALVNHDWCDSCGDGGALLCCEGCANSFHMGCLDPPLMEVPEGEWLCRTCKPLPVRINDPSQLSCLYCRFPQRVESRILCKPPLSRCLPRIRTRLVFPAL
jgi:hypothetical protein